MTDAAAYPVCAHGKKIYERCDPCKEGAVRGEHGGFQPASESSKELCTHVTLARWVNCGDTVWVCVEPNCDFEIHAPETNEGIPCVHCQATGDEQQVYDSETGWSEEKPCDTCDGTGRIRTVAQYLKTLPADWHKDSSLETWFPITAKHYDRLCNSETLGDEDNPLLLRVALGNLVLAIRQLPPSSPLTQIDKDINFAIGEAEKLLGPHYAEKTNESTTQGSHPGETEPRSNTLGSAEPTDGTSSVDAQALNELPPDVVDRALNSLVDFVDEKLRLEKLTNEQLVAECLNSEAADFEIVTELMDRLVPGWHAMKTKQAHIGPDPVYCTTCGQEDRDCYCDPSQPAPWCAKHPNTATENGCNLCDEISRRAGNGEGSRS